MQYRPVTQESFPRPKFWNFYQNNAFLPKFESILVLSTSFPIQIKWKLRFAEKLFTGSIKKTWVGTNTPLYCLKSFSSSSKCTWRTSIRFPYFDFSCPNVFAIYSQMRQYSRPNPRIVGRAFGGVWIWAHPAVVWKSKKPFTTRQTKETYGRLVDFIASSFIFRFRAAVGPRSRKVQESF